MQGKIEFQGHMLADTRQHNLGTAARPAERDVKGFFRWIETTCEVDFFGVRRHVQRERCANLISRQQHHRRDEADPCQG